MTGAEPTLFLLSTGADLARALPPAADALQVVAIDASGGGAAAVEALTAARIHTPWLLAGSAADAELLEEVATLVLSGEPQVFGLAGVVLVGAGDGGHAAADAAADGIRGLALPVAATADASGLADVAAALGRAIAARSPRVPAPWGRIIASDRTDPPTRAILARLAIADDPDYVPAAVNVAQLAVLRAVAERLMPQGPGPGIDLGARVDQMLSSGEGDGWRTEGMPSDLDAYGAGLDAIGAEWPADAAGQDARIRSVLSGEAASGTVLTPTQLRSWFGDLRNDLARAWLSHPASLARVGYDGFATGGTGPEPAGFTVLAAGLREAWEPEELGRLAEETSTR